MLREREVMHRSGLDLVLLCLIISNLEKGTSNTVSLKGIWNRGSTNNKIEPTNQTNPNQQQQQQYTHIEGGEKEKSGEKWNTSAKEKTLKRGWVGRRRFNPTSPQ